MSRSQILTSRVMMKLISLCFPLAWAGECCRPVARMTLRKWWPVSLLFVLSSQFSYAQDILDVLGKNCFVCHGPSVKPPMGGLAFSGSDALKRGGKRGPAVVPWKSAESLLFKAVSRTGELKMPPAGPISSEEIEVIRKWIDAGAVWPNKKAELHWAYRPVVRPPVPQVKHPEWVSNEIDAFIVDAYEKKNLTPAPLANRATLLRRVSYDLIGLPPTSQELALFVNDSGPNDY